MDTGTNSPPHLRPRNLAVALALPLLSPWPCPYLTPRSPPRTTLTVIPTLPRL